MKFRFWNHVVKMLIHPLKGNILLLLEFSKSKSTAVKLNYFFSTFEIVLHTTFLFSFVYSTRVKNFKLNLDIPAEHRWAEIVEPRKEQVNCKNNTYYQYLMNYKFQTTVK